MVDIIFTFIITFLVLFVCWFLPKAGTSEYTEPTRMELLVIAIISCVPAGMIAIML